jgi:hypothetical protein
MVTKEETMKFMQDNFQVKIEGWIICQENMEKHQENVQDVVITLQ